jgi:hypothetical protein
VEIDESAYPLMWTVLDEIAVKVKGKKAKGTGEYRRNRSSV